MADQSALKLVFAEYARTIARHYEIGDVLHRLTDQIVDILRVDGAGVSIADPEGGLQFVTASSARVSHVEAVQVASGQGPCHDAFRSGDQVTVADLRVEERWPDYTPVARDVGLRAVAGLPMVVGEERIGALNVYHGTPREWPADDLGDAQLVADMAAGYIIIARNRDTSRRLAAQLQHALDSRVVIEQAKGVIAERHGVDMSTAFQRVRSYARGSNRKIHDVAADIVEGRLDL